MGLIHPAAGIFLSATYSLKRFSGSGGQTGALAAFATGIAGTGLFPVSNEVALRLKLDAPYRARTVFLSGILSTKEGDYLNDGTTDYRIKDVGPWTFQWQEFTMLVVEQQVTS